MVIRQNKNCVINYPTKDKEYIIMSQQHAKYTKADALKKKKELKDCLDLDSTVLKVKEEI